jgi:hypothetical protein
VTSGTPPADGPELQDPPDGDHPTFDTSVAHVARIYDYWLGGKDNYAVDRAAGDAALKAYPDLIHSVRSNRSFLARAVRYLAAEAGIRQFLDIGTRLCRSSRPTVATPRLCGSSVAWRWSSRG